jgi:hypothetical protein
MKLLRTSIAFFALALSFLSCEGPAPQFRAEMAATKTRFAQAPPDRPGLGTKWGETRTSPVAAAQFERADPFKPFATASIYYNDAEGIRAMVSAVAWQRTAPLLAAPAANLISVELRDENGRLLPGLVVGNRWFVVGEEGRRYSILVRITATFVWKLCSRWMDLMSLTGGQLHFASAAIS